MSDILFFDVDTQFDFMDPHGALYVPTAEQILAPLKRLLDCAGRNGLTTISTLCSHEPGDPELNQFPAHCMVGTPGQARVLPDAPALPRQRISRGSTSPLALDAGVHYVAEKNTVDVFLCPWLKALSAAGALRDRRCFVFGVALDYCVRFAALGLLIAGAARVSLVTDAVRGLAPEPSFLVLAELQARGARFCTVDETLSAVENGTRRDAH